MLTPELQNYINQQKTAGVLDAQIRQALASQGWTQADLDQAFGTLTAPQTPQAPIAGVASARMSIATKIIIFSLGAVIIAGTGYAYYRYQSSTYRYESSIEPATAPEASMESLIQDLLTVEKIKSLKTTSNNSSGDYFIGSTEEQKAIVSAFVKDNSKSDSTYLYIAANTAYRIGDIKAAGFLYYAAQLRKQFDIKRYGLSKSNGNNIQTYWGFLRETTGQMVNPAVVKDPEIFAEVVDMINIWQVIPSDDALYSAEEYGKYVLLKPTWEATAEAIKQDFKVEFVDVIKSRLETQPALSPASQTPSANDPYIDSSGPKQKTCGNWPVNQQDNNYLDGAKFFSKIDASTTANGIPFYLNATKLIQIDTAAGKRTMQQVLMCAKATTPASITDYYKKMAGYTVADTASLPASYNNANLNLGSLHPQEIVQNSGGQLLIYDVGNGDILLFYSYR